MFKARYKLWRRIKGRLGICTGQTFKVRIEGDKKALLAKVRRRADKQGVNLEGDESSGQLSGLVSGHYEVSGDLVAVTIEKKPLIASWKMVESRIRQLFA